MRHLNCLLPCVLILAGHSTGQGTWQRRTFDARDGHAMAYDPVRERVVLFGGQSSLHGSSLRLATPVTWEWAGDRWLDVHPEHSPEPRLDPALAWDPVRRQVLLFGGRRSDLTTLDDTWAWDGNDWERLHPIQSPSPRAAARMTEEPTRSRVLLFGGMPGGLPPALSDTWSWDGADWQQLTPSVTPQPRAHQTLTYDPLRDLVVMFSGSFNGSRLPNLWEWDGADWVQRTYSNGPTPRHRCAAWFDPWLGGVLVFGGSLSGQAVYDESWLWDGIAWQRIADTARPTARDGHAGAYHAARGHAVIFSGVITPLFRELVGDTWVRDARGWNQVQDIPNPEERRACSIALNDATTAALMFGGMTPGSRLMGDTWELVGRRWSQLHPVRSPPARTEAAMAYDPVSGQILLFGGRDSYHRRFSDMWAWDGAEWSELFPAHLPAGRMEHAMAYDPRRQRVVMFGGTSNDTWEWDGSDWKERAPRHQPTGRSEHAMTDDPLLGGVLLHGGYIAGVGATDDTWLWDGSDWIQLSPATVPPARHGHTMKFDPVRGRVRMLGGTDFRATLEEWDWDGRDWSRADNGPWASGHDVYGLFVSPEDGRFTAVGAGPESLVQDVWSLTIPEPATFERFGAGCAGTGGTPDLDAERYSRPWRGDRFGVVVTGLPASAAVLIELGATRTDVPLDVLGMPGCTLLVGVLDAVPLANTGGRASWTATIPTDAALRGVRFTMQALALDPGANALGATTSNGGEGRIQ